MIIKVDSREQLPLQFDVCGNVTKVLTIGLPFGDYWASIQNKDGSEGQDIPIIFERKGIEDCLTTVTVGADRFKREIERANNAGCKLYMIIEGSLYDVIRAETGRYVKEGSIIKAIFTFKVKYGLEPIFCTDRNEMKRYMLETWEAFGRNFKHLGAPKSGAEDQTQPIGGIA